MAPEVTVERSQEAAHLEHVVDLDADRAGLVEFPELDARVPVVKGDRGDGRGLAATRATDEVHEGNRSALGPDADVAVAVGSTAACASHRRQARAEPVTAFHGGPV